jgi:hypothetical protein
VIFSGALRVAARGSAMPVSDRKLGSANGNRTCLPSVQLSSVESNCFILRSVRPSAITPNALQLADVAARWQREATKTPQARSAPVISGCGKAAPHREVRHAFET